MSQQNKTFFETLSEQPGILGQATRGVRVAERPADQKPIKALKPGQSWYPPGTTQGEKEGWQLLEKQGGLRPPTKSIHAREDDEDEMAPLSYAKGGKVIKSERY